MSDPRGEPGNGVNTLLRVEDLRVTFPTRDGEVRAVDGLSFTVRRGTTLGIVGESGSGKSAAGLAVLGLHDPQRTRLSGRILIEDRDVLDMVEDDLRRLRGRDVSMIFQDALSALHPYFTVGAQIAEAYRVHHRVARGVAHRRAVEMLDRVGIPEPARRAGQYPHEYSGGMRQRAMIAMALVNDPALVIADEPTTALDVTVQAQILDLLADLQREFHSAIILITHDLGVVRHVADDVLVMYAGRAVERGPVERLLADPRHPYTRGLLGCAPTLTGDPDADLVPIPGSPPSLISPPPGCPFHPRCRDELGPAGPCRTLLPEPLPIPGEPARLAACHLPEAHR